MQSANVITDAIVKQGEINRQVIVVGASAAGPSIHYTLGKLLDHRELMPDEHQIFKVTAT